MAASRIKMKSTESTKDPAASAPHFIAFTSWLFMIAGAVIAGSTLSPLIWMQAAFEVGEIVGSIKDVEYETGHNYELLKMIVEDAFTLSWVITGFSALLWITGFGLSRRHPLSRLSALSVCAVLASWSALWVATDVYVIYFYPEARGFSMIPTFSFLALAAGSVMIGRELQEPWIRGQFVRRPKSVEIGAEAHE